MPAPLYRNVHLADGGILSVAALDLQPQQVLSTAMPTPAQVGMLAYATDTFQLLQYQSATTGWTQPWNLPWGRVAEAQVTANQTGISAPVDITNLTVTFTAVANRRYKISLMLGLVTQSASTGTVTVVIVSGTGAGTQLAAAQGAAIVANAGIPISLISPTQSPAAGAITYHGRITTSAGTCNVNAASTTPSTILVEDIGPSANPA